VKSSSKQVLSTYFRFTGSQLTGFRLERIGDSRFFFEFAVDMKSNSKRIH